jgi:hypothetical protein
MYDRPTTQARPNRAAVLGRRGTDTCQRLDHKSAARRSSRGSTPGPLLRRPFATASPLQARDSMTVCTHQTLSRSCVTDKSDAGQKGFRASWQDARIP